MDGIFATSSVSFSLSLELSEDELDDLVLEELLLLLRLIMELAILTASSSSEETSEDGDDEPDGDGDNDGESVSEVFFFLAVEVVAGNEGFFESIDGFLFLETESLSLLSEVGLTLGLADLTSSSELSE